MTVAITVLTIFFSSWMYTPSWFNEPGYIYHSTHKSLQECKDAKLEDGDVCAVLNKKDLNDEKPFQLYVRKK